jgi:hypothetical protein
MQLPPFLSDAPMQGDPACGWDDFLAPQLRRFSREYTKVRLSKALGHGIEGAVARVKFDDDVARFALKIVCDCAPSSSNIAPSIKRCLTRALAVLRFGPNRGRLVAAGARGPQRGGAREGAGWPPPVFS